MKDFSDNFSIQDAMARIQSPAGQQLLSLLQQSKDEGLQKAMELAAKGDSKGAMSYLQGIANSTQVQELLWKMGGK